MYKVTVLYHHPKDAQQFEDYYYQKHLEFAKQIPELLRLELTRCEASPGEAPPAYYRIADLYFRSKETMEEAMGTPMGQTTIDDLLNLATGGVTVLLSTVEEVALT